MPQEFVDRRRSAKGPLGCHVDELLPGESDHNGVLLVFRGLVERLSRDLRASSEAASGRHACGDKIGKSGVAPFRKWRSEQEPQAVGSAQKPKTSAALPVLKARAAALTRSNASELTPSFSRSPRSRHTATLAWPLAAARETGVTTPCRSTKAQKRRCRVLRLE